MAWNSLVQWIGRMPADCVRIRRECSVPGRPVCSAGNRGVESMVAATEACGFGRACRYSRRGGRNGLVRVSGLWRSGVVLRAASQG